MCCTDSTPVHRPPCTKNQDQESHTLLGHQRRSGCHTAAARVVGRRPGLRFWRPECCSMLAAIRQATNRTRGASGLPRCESQYRSRQHGAVRVSEEPRPRDRRALAGVESCRPDRHQPRCPAMQTETPAGPRWLSNGKSFSGTQAHDADANRECRLKQQNPPAAPAGMAEGSGRERCPRNLML